MAKKNDLTNPEALSEYICRLSNPLAEMVLALRRIVLSADSNIGERIKWNSPNFFYTGSMAESNPKEYKRDIVVINLHKGYPILVFPSGSVIAIYHDLLEGNYADGRRLMTFKSLEEINSISSVLVAIFKNWVEKVE